MRLTKQHRITKNHSSKKNDAIYFDKYVYSHDLPLLSRCKKIMKKRKVKVDVAARQPWEGKG